MEGFGDALEAFFAFLFIVIAALVMLVVVLVLHIIGVEFMTGVVVVLIVGILAFIIIKRIMG